MNEFKRNIKLNPTMELYKLIIATLLNVLRYVTLLILSKLDIALICAHREY